MTPKGRNGIKNLNNNHMKTINNTWKICLALGLTTGATLAGLIVNPHYFFFALIFGLAMAIFTASHGKKSIN